MNVKVITRHGPSNYGSLLQSIATVNVIEQLGYDCSVIDYQRDDERGLNMVLTQLSQKGRFANPLKRFAYIAVRYPIEKLAQSRFDRMRHKYLKMTRRCSNHQELEQLNADFFLTGSDQVWGPTMCGKYDSAYFLQFVPEGAKRLAYAASLGKTTFDKPTEEAYKEMLATYDQIAVREDSAVELMKEWGITNCKGQVIDPTLLMNGEEWARLMITDNLQKKYERMEYILVYQIHNDPQLSIYAKELSKEIRLPLLRVNPFMHQAFRGGQFINCPDVSEFLALFKNATYIVTDSFHGTCFSLNFNKQFIEILPNNATGTRNVSILALTNLSDRIVTDYHDFGIIDSIIDYAPVNAILEKERARSIHILKNLFSPNF